MDIDNEPNLEALKRTAAWVNEVSKMNGDLTEEMPKKFDHDSDQEEPQGQLQNIYEQLKDQFNNSMNNEIDIPKTVTEFKKLLEKFGISQRFAAKNIMEKTSQGNLSFLLDKGKHKHWHELSPRGRVPYIRMRRWLDSHDEQHHTVSLLQKTKEYKKTGPKEGGGRREKFTVFQLMVLCRFYEEDPNPNLSTRALLADKLGAPIDRVTIWFQNQRARGFPAKKMLSQSNLVQRTSNGEIKSNNLSSSVTSSNYSNEETPHSRTQFIASQLSSSSVVDFSQSNHLLHSEKPHSPSQDQSSFFSSKVHQTHSMKSELYSQDQQSKEITATPGQSQRLPHPYREALSMNQSDFPKISSPMTAHSNNQSYTNRSKAVFPEQVYGQHQKHSSGHHGNIPDLNRVKVEPASDNSSDEPLNFSMSNGTS